MSASGLPSNSSLMEIRAMSLMDLAPRNASTKRSEERLRLPNSMSFVTSRVQEKIEASTRPIITTLTTGSASRNMVIGVRRRPWETLVGAAMTPPLS